MPSFDAIDQWNQDELSPEDEQALQSAVLGTDVVGKFSKPKEMVLPEMDFTTPTEPTQPSAPPPLPAAPQSRVVQRMDSLQRAPVPQPSKAGAVDWANLGKRLQDATRRSQGLRDNESYFSNVVQSYRPDMNAGEQTIKAEGIPAQVNAQRLESESKQAGLDALKAKGASTAADNDPNSLQSQQARNAIKSMFPGMKLPDGFDDWSAAAVKRLFDPKTVGNLQAERERAANAAADDQRKIVAGQQKAEAEKQALENSRKNFAPVLMEMGIEPSRASQEDIKLAASIKHAKANEKMAAAQLAIANKKEGRAEEEHQALSETIPFERGELRYTGKGTPPEADRKKAQEIASGWNAALAGMDDLKGSLQNFSSNPGIESKRDVESKVRVVSAALNSAVGGGAMSEAEAAAMSKALGADILSPTGVQAIVNHIIGDDPAAAQALLTRLESVRQSAKTTAAGKLKSYRYEMGGGGDGLVTLTHKDGRSKRVKKSVAESYLQAHPGEATIGE